jgi:phospholipid N-methyltransferase
MTAARSIFFRKFFIEPAKIGSVTPSSGYLTRKMLANLPWDQLDSIVELGAGTGVFTEYIAQHKKKDCQVVVIEQDALMRKELEHRFPDMHFGSQAENLPYILQKFDLPKVNCVISGLPFAMFPAELRRRILSGVEVSLEEEGHFIAFQYSLQMYPAFHRLFRQVKIGFELRNFPPAFVYTCRK